MRKGIIVVILIVFSSSCYKDIDEFQSSTFVKYFGSGYESVGNDVVALDDGGYLMTGYDNDGTTNQILAVRLDKYGNWIWNNTFGNNLFHESGNLIRHGSDGYYLAGLSTALTSDISHAFVMKVSESGDSLWFRTIGNLSYDTELNDMYVGEDGVYLGGSVKTMQGEKKLFRAKLSLQGDSLWVNDFQGINNDGYKRIFESDNGLLYVGHDANDKLVLSKISLSRGTSSSVYTNVSDINVSDAVIHDQTIALLSNMNNSFSVFKLNADYTLAWETEVLSNISGKGLVLLDNEKLIGFGMSGENTGDNGSSLLTHFVLVNKDGSLAFGENNLRDIPGCINQARSTLDGGVVFTGYTNATFGKKAQLLKTDNELFLLKPKQF